MARPQRFRRICALPAHTVFSPADRAAGDRVEMSLDEYETIRLIDHEGCTHEQCASVMQISRTTVTEIYAAARRKIADALVEGRPLYIDGGRVRICDGRFRCERCYHPGEAGRNPGEGDDAKERGKHA